MSIRYSSRFTIWIGFICITFAIVLQIYGYYFQSLSGLIWVLTKESFQPFIYILRKLISFNLQYIVGNYTDHYEVKTTFSSIFSLFFGTFHSNSYNALTSSLGNLDSSETIIGLFWLTSGPQNIAYHRGGRFSCVVYNRDRATKIFTTDRISTKFLKWNAAPVSHRPPPSHLAESLQLNQWHSQNQRIKAINFLSGTLRSLNIHIIIYIVCTTAAAVLHCVFHQDRRVEENRSFPTNRNAAVWEIPCIVVVTCK